MKYPEEFKTWQTTSNYLAQLSITDERSLNELYEKAIRKSIKAVPFYEPDLDNQLTAVAFEPGDESRRLLSSLSLMLKERKLETIE